MQNGFEVVSNGNCTICGKPLTGNRLFLCEECAETNRASERKRGEWMNKCGNKVCTCSSCGEDYDHTYEWIEEWNFCPNCGADMRGAE